MQKKESSTICNLKQVAWNSNSMHQNNKAGFNNDKLSILPIQQNRNIVKS